MNKDRREVIKKAWKVPTVIALGALVRPLVAGESCIQGPGHGHGHGNGHHNGWDNHHGRK